MEGAEKSGSGDEGEIVGVGGFVFEGPEEGVGEEAEHVLGAFVILLAVLALSGLLGGIVDEGLDAGVRAELVGSEGVAVALAFFSTAL